MSDLPALRRSLRNRLPPRNPDSPVSFAARVARNSEDSSSDEDVSASDIVHGLESSLDSGGRQQASEMSESLAPQQSQITLDRGRESNVTSDSLLAAQLQAESLDGSGSDTDALPGLLTPDDHSEDEDGGDESFEGADFQGTLQEQADRLIQNIARLQGRDPTNIFHPLASAPVSRALDPPSGPPASGPMSAISIEARTGHAQALYFVGVHPLNSEGRTFCEMRTFVDANAHNGALLQRLQHSGGPLGRALGALTDHSIFYVGSSSYPIDVAYNYGHHSFGFREIDSLLQLESSHSDEIVFRPAPPSAERTALLTSQGASLDIPVYVLYVYHKDSQPPLQMPIAVPTSRDDLPNHTPLAVATPTAPVATPTLLSRFLLTRFANEYTELATWRTAAYGTAYSRCLIERKIHRICQLLGISVIGRQHNSIFIDSHTVRLEDVVQAAGINFQTWSTWRTELGNARRALAILRRLDRTQELPAEHEPLLRGLEAMFRERVLPVSHGGASANDPEAEAEIAAVTWSASWLNTQSRRILNGDS